MTPEVVKYVAKRIGWSLSGLVATYRSERSFRLWVGVVASSDLAAFATLDGPQCATIFILGGAVLCLELVNTAVENAVDLVTREVHPLAKLAKDAGSAAVALAGVILFCAWLFAILGNY